MEDAWSMLNTLCTRSTTHPRGRWTELITLLADRQSGMVAAWQLVELGISRRGIFHRVRTGLLYPMHPGVFAVGHRRPDGRGRLAAAVLSGGRGALLSHRAAAWVWGLVDVAPTAIDVIAGSKRVDRGPARFHRVTIRGDERAVREGLPLTGVSRTILDLAAVLGEPAVERLLDRAESDLRDRLSLPILLERYPRRPGTPLIRRVLVRRRGLSVTRSVLEERFLAFVAERSLPPPRLNVPVRVVGAHAYEIDCYWPSQRLAVELDGYERHGGRSAFREDRIRDRRLRTIGIETLRVSNHDVTEGSDELGRDLLAILARS